MATRRIKRTPRKPQPSRRSSRRVEAETRTATVAAGTRKNEEMKRSTLVLILMAILVAFGLYLVFRPNNTTAPTTGSSQEQSNEITYQGVEGKTALELLKEKHKVETKTYEGVGELVTSINGKASTNNEFWIYYVNGRQGEVGAGTYVTKSTDTITWKFEKSQ